MPSSRSVGRISFSMPRESSEYSICRSEMGCTADEVFLLQEGSSQKTEALKKAHALKQLLHTLANAYQQGVGRIQPDIWLISQTFEKVIGLKDVCEQRAIAKGRQT